MATTSIAPSIPSEIVSLPQGRASGTSVTRTEPFPGASAFEKPIILHLGADIVWNHDLYQELGNKFEIKRSHSMSREEFKGALKDGLFGPFFAMYRPFWNTGGEMGRWDEELIQLLPKSCKIFASAGAGYDWVDVKTMAEHGVIYCNSAPACTESVADTAIYLIISVFRLLMWSSSCARSLSISQFNDANRNIAAITYNPAGHTLGIIGLGRIGYRIAEKARCCFNMRILYQDVIRKPLDVEARLEATYFPDLHEMLSHSDCVILCTPFGGNILLSHEQFSYFKPGARFVNIARGKLVDEDALAAALESGRLSAAGLDVHSDEPQVNPRLSGMRNVECLSHTAGASVDSHVGFERLGIENILCYWEKGEAITPVNMEWLPERSNYTEDD